MTSKNKSVKRVKESRIKTKTTSKNLTSTKTKSNNSKKKYSKWQIALYVFLLIIFVGIIASCILVTSFFIYIASTAPKFNTQKLYTSEPSVVYDSDGKVIANIGTQDRVLLTYDELPEVLVNAIIATEDSKFFQHNGLDLPRFLVASTKQVLGGYGGGASTITMQLSKNFYTNTNAEGIEGIIRKFKDIYMSVFKIEPSYSKQEILEFYVNSFFLGNGYGVEVTAKNYFGKSAKDLNLSEAAMIAGLFQAPGSYNPYTNPEDTEERRQTVLYLMRRHGYISEEEYKIAKEMTVEKIVQPSTSSNIGSGLVDPDNQYFVDMVIEDVIKKTGKNPYTTSMKIYSTLNSKAQKAVSDIMNGKNYKWQNSKVQGAVAVVDIETGAIQAVGGGRNVKAANTLNRATKLNKQIGSTAKPLYDYGPAIEYLNWNTGTILADEKTTYSDGTEINNWDGSYIGYNTIETHLKLSRNIPALKTFKALDKKNIIEFVTNLGLAPEIYSCDSGYRLSRNKCINKTNQNDIVDAKQTKPLHEAHAIGGYNGENPLSMATAYAAFGNGGYYNEPYSFTKIVYSDTDETYVNKTETKQVMSDSTAYIITHMLQETASYGIDSGSYRDVNGIKYAAKTGTTNFDEDTKKEKKLPYNAVNDYWVVGYNTQYSIAVWYGYDKISDGYNLLGSSQHQRLFQAVAKKVFTSKKDFEKPSSVVQVTTEADSATPILPSEFTPSAYKRTSLFVSGTEPNKVSTRFSRLEDVGNLTASNNGDGTATISWSPVGTPDALNLSYITDLNKSAFNGSGASRYASTVLAKNKAILGSLGYNVYVQGNDGKLTLKGWTSSTNYKLSEANGTYKVVVKTCYSKFKSNMSNGKNVTVNITGAIETPPIVEPEDGDSDVDDNTEEPNTNTDGNV